MFEKKISPPSSGLKIKPSKKLTVAGDKLISSGRSVKT
jgi:hypothetical protein